MDYYNDLPERICHIRKHYMSIPEQYEYDDLPFYENKSSLSSANCRKVADALSTLLVVYQEDGTEYQPSRTKAGSQGISAAWMVSQA